MITNVSTAAGLMTALKAASAGDTIQLASGNYAGVSINNLNFARDITITSQSPAAQASLVGLKVTNSSGITFSDLDLATGTGNAATVAQSHDIHFEQVHVHGSMDGDPQNDPGGILIRTSDDVTVTGSEFEQLLWGISHDESTHLTVTDNAFHDLQLDGMRGGGSSYVTISRNTFTDYDPAPGDHPDAVQFWTTGTTASAHNILISDNVFMRGSGGAIQGVFMRDEVGGLPFQDVVIRGNLFSGTRYNGISINNAEGVVIEDNIIQGFIDKKSWIRLISVDDATLSDNAANQVVLTDSTDVVQTGTVILAQASDDGAEVKSMWDAAHRPGAGVSLQGTTGVDLLLGGRGADTLNGVSGADTLSGGAGDDLYIIGSKATIVEVSGGGVDTVRSSMAFTLTGDVENLELTGTRAVNALGNALGNVITGNDAANSLTGRGGDDTLTGGGGADTFVFGRRDGHDVIRDFGAGGEHDAIDASSLLDIGVTAKLAKSQAGVLITFSTGETLFVDHVKLAQLHATETGWVF